MKRIAISLLAATSMCLAADEPPKVYEHDVALWKEVPVPPRTSYEDHGVFFQRANQANVEWTVERQEKTVRAVLSNGRNETPEANRPSFSMEMPLGSLPSVAPVQVLNVNDGWLAGYNRGEFGAALWWYAIDGKQRSKISDDQVNQFIVHKERIFAVEGLAHLGMDDGTLIEIRHNGNQWTAATFVELPGCGQAITVLDDGRFCIATMSMLLAVSLDKKMEILVPRAEWTWLPVNSITVDAKSENVYIGMRQFVARYNLKANDHSYQFLIPSLDFLNKTTGQ
ncbi:MAG: hypothetical protein IAE77_01395 [Prosthecobacter sp.]|jgi:hypothetical protein|uniref:hypothetical protein n=1 Tax=Prosthecobacter sp. TaxID=1965333 RepID=UPI001A104BCE|nr:hypothetical protein [Prosthecobacter sp.]MBE2282096.1 hypothetical protein [Prosthecobacter sp.]